MRELKNNHFQVFWQGLLSFLPTMRELRASLTGIGPFVSVKFFPDYEGIEGGISSICITCSLSFFPIMRELRTSFNSIKVVSFTSFSPDYEGIEDFSSFFIVAIISGFSPDYEGFIDISFSFCNQKSQH